MSGGTASEDPARTTADVAVIIPAYRSAGVLDTTLASVAAQTLLPREVVVADDASGDATAEVARAWSGRLPVTTVVLDENRGPGGARRIAIEHTTSPRLALLDADDVWLPDHLETLVAAHDRLGGIVTADPIRWLPGTALSETSVGRDLPIPPPAAQRAAILRHDFVFIGTLFERADYEAAGGFRDQFRGPEDWDLWIRMIRRGTVVHRADHPTVLYRLSAESGSAHERMVEQERAVVLAALAESTTEEDHRVLTRTLRDIEARTALQEAYGLARADRPWGARSRAVGGLRGPGRIRSRCAAILVAPRLATRARDQRVHDPRWWLRVSGRRSTQWWRTRR